LCRSLSLFLVRSHTTPALSLIQNDRISHICAAEHVTLAPGAMDALARVSGGDLRKAITTLQSASCLAAGAPVTPGVLDDVSGAVPAQPVDAIMAACAHGKAWADLTGAVGDAVAEGWPALGLLLGLQAAVVAAPGLPPASRAAACTALAAADRALADGSDESVQLVAAAAAVREAVRAGAAMVE
jgi:replication factor C subunit 2/4